MNKTCLVKILKATSYQYWYANDYIGKVFEVEEKMIEDGDTTWWKLSGTKKDYCNGTGFINLDDCVKLTKKEATEYQLENMRTEANLLAEKINSLECELENFDKITQDDIYPGALFYPSHNTTSFYCILETYDGLYVFSGLHGDRFKMYFMTPRSRKEIIEYLYSLGAKKGKHNEND